MVGILIATWILMVLGYGLAVVAFLRTNKLMMLLMQAGYAISVLDAKFEHLGAIAAIQLHQMGYVNDPTCGRRYPCKYNPKTWHTLPCTQHAIVWTMLNMGRCAW